MSEMDSLNVGLVMIDENGTTTIIEPKFDDTKDLTPELRAKLLAINERARLRRPKMEVPPENDPSSETK